MHRLCLCLPVLSSLVLFALAGQAAADDPPNPSESALIVIQGTLDKVDDTSLSLSKVVEILVVDDNQPATVARIELAAFEKSLWGKSGPFATAAPGASLGSSDAETLSLISIGEVKIAGDKLEMHYTLNLGELPDPGDRVVISIAGPIDSKDSDSDDEVTPDAAKFGSKHLPAGLLDHNPLNIRPLSRPDKWVGQVGIHHSNDASFVIFQDFPYGLRAAADLLRNYQRNHGINRLLGPKGYGAEDGIITRWAPGTDHNYDKVYIERVTELTGFKPEQELDLEDGATIAKLIGAMTRVELGIPDGKDLPYTDDDMQTALELGKFE